MFDEWDEDDLECPECGSWRVAIEAVPLNDDPVIFVCRDCGEAFYDDDDLDE